MPMSARAWASDMTRRNRTNLPAASTLRLSAMAAAALLMTWPMLSTAAPPALNALPTGGTVTAGAATLTQQGNTLNINQSSGSAIASFGTFSIGANAVVNINQPGTASSFLARVTGTDPSRIYGLLKSNGAVALINQNGILVGPTGVVDVSRFIASTLNFSDSDFLAGRLTFTSGDVAGRVVNQGVIRTSSGGSVYLIGADVKNSGTISSPNGEVLLAAGQTVQLVDTGTPGVTVNVTGAGGKVTNLGTLAAQAGSIGVAAGLIDNSGAINASSVVSEGGRIFLRASQNLTTTASSTLAADGASQGGKVVLSSDKVAYLDGAISATGHAGQGGYVETSGKQSLDVVKLPAVGSGGEWLIDPYALDVVAGSAGNTSTSASTSASTSGNVITSTGSGSTVSAGTVSGMLNSGADVVLATGADGGAGSGDITVSAAINKTSGPAASLSLNADGNINVDANIVSTTDTLALNLRTNVNSAEGGTHTATVSNATLGLNGGALNVSDGAEHFGNGNLVLNSGGVLDFSQGGGLSVGSLTLLGGATLNAAASANLNLAGALNNGGAVSLNNAVLNAASFVNTGTLALDNAAVNAGAFTNDTGGHLSGNGTISVGSGAGVLLNNGTIAPGGDGATGLLSITGGYSQSATGTLSIDIAGAGNVDTLNYSAQSLSLDGTLQTTLLNGYVPTLGTSFAVITGPVSDTAPGVFRHVLGDVIFSGGAPQMIKPVYNPSGAGLSLVMAGPETITYTGTAESLWGNAYFWSTGYFPTAIDNVVVAAGGRLSHGAYDGVDTVNSITFDAGANLYLSGGTLNVTNLGGNGSVVAGGGVLAYTGTVNLAALSLIEGASIVGTGSASQLNIAESFSQNGGSIASGGDVSVTQSVGDLTVGDITARNLTLTATSGAIAQQSSPLHVTQWLSTSSADGTTLTLAGNRVAGVAASNTTRGDIAIVDNLDTADAGAVNVGRIANAGGNVSIGNTGAMTVGAAGVNATGAIVLSVANTGAVTDNLTLNGALSSAGGNIGSFAGNDILVNANVTTQAPGLVTFNAANGVVTYAPGVSISDARGTAVPTPALPGLPGTPATSVTPPVVPDTPASSQTAASGVTQAVTPTSNAVVQAVTSTQTVATSVMPPTLPVEAVNTSSAQAMTVGGDPGTFGGTDTTAASGASPVSGKAATAKLYCD